MALEQEKMDLVHRGIIETVQVFTKICDENNLKYLMTGGTLIGAVRHQGFIPWDDDMDIFMPREDYEKLLKIPQERLNENIKIKHYTNKDGNNQYLTIKFENSDYKITKKSFEKIVKENLFIDIFPLDGFPNNFFLSVCHKISLKWRMQMIRLARLQFYDKDQEISKKMNPLKKVLYGLDKFTRVFSSMNYVKQISKFEAELKKYKYFESEKCFFAMGPYGMFREIYPKKLFEETKMYKFENIELRGVIDYDRHLRQVYGDYMKLPPEEKRVCLHMEDIKYEGEKR